MAYEHDYHRQHQNPMSYGDIDNARVTSRGILITLGLIALAIGAVFFFSSIDVVKVDRSATGATQSPSAAPALPNIDSTPKQPVE